MTRVLVLAPAVVPTQRRRFAFALLVVSVGADSLGTHCHAVSCSIYRGSLPERAMALGE